MHPTESPSLTTFQLYPPPQVSTAFQRVTPTGEQAYRIRACGGDFSLLTAIMCLGPAGVTQGNDTLVFFPLLW